MSREEVAAFMRNLQLSLDSLQRQVEAGLKRLPGVERSALPDFLAQQKRSFSTFCEEQAGEFDKFIEEAGLQVEGTAAAAAAAGEAAGGGTPYHVQLRSVEQRMASMGGIPALGACVLPKMTPGVRHQLKATASPAAVDIMRGEMEGSDVTPLRKTSSLAPQELAATPLVQLRAVQQATPQRTQHAAEGSASPPNSELATALQRRMQRQATADTTAGAAIAAEQQA